MPRGGARPGAGRKPGQTSKLTEQNIARARKTGDLPHEMMLDAARDLFKLASKHHPDKAKGDIDKYVTLVASAIDAASKAAPYFASKRSSITIKDERLDLSKLTEAQLDQLESIVTAARDDGGHSGRTGTTLQ